MVAASVGASVVALVGVGVAAVPQAARSMLLITTTDTKINTYFDFIGISLVQLFTYQANLERIQNRILSNIIETGMGAPP